MPAGGPSQFLNFPRERRNKHLFICLMGWGPSLSLCGAPAAVANSDIKSQLCDNLPGGTSGGTAVIF